MRRLFVVHVRGLVVTAMAVLLAAAPGTAKAQEVMLNVEDKVFSPPIAAPISSFFDVFFEVVTGTPDLAAYIIRLELTLLESSSGSVQFTSPFVEQPQIPHPPIFPANPPQDFGSDAVTIQAAADLPAGSVVVTDDAGLIRVLFQVAPGTVGAWSVAIHVSATTLTNGAGNDLTFSVNNGTIVVPEPACAAVLLSLLAFSRQRRAK